MSEQSPSLPACLLFAPMNDGVASSESDAGHLSDLFVCRSTGRFFALPSAQILIEPRSSRSAKQFFCPVCPKSPLKLSSTSISCSSCGWDAAITGVTSVAELLQRDGDPFPWISADMRRLSRRLNQTDDAATVVQEPAAPGVPRTSSVHHLLGKRQSMRHVERQSPGHQISKAESASLCAQRFVEEQEERERRVFSRWMPEEESWDWTGPGRPEGRVEAMMAEVEMDELVELDERVCSTTWRKRELAARRRVPAPKVSIRSPFGGGKTRKAMEVAPEIEVWIRDECEKGGDDDGEKAVTVRLSNKQDRGELAVTVANADAPGEHARTAVAKGGSVTLTLSPFSFREEHVADMLHDEPIWSRTSSTARRCERVAVLDISLQYTASDGGSPNGDVSWLRVYARHAR